MPNIYQYHRLPDLKLDFYYLEIEVDRIEGLDNTLNDSERDKLLILVLHLHIIFCRSKNH